MVVIQKDLQERAAILLGTEPKTIRPFEANDLYNIDLRPEGNTLRGFLCIKSSNLYGSLVIFAVNDEPCEQIIYGTPKLRYPFDKNGVFNWPAINQLEVWEKLDGTNILAYTYKYQNKEYLTYKTRLTPTLRDTAFGSFHTMWQEYLEDHSWVEEIIKLNPDYNLSFELYGSRNPITVMYEVPLAVGLLFGVRKQDHAIKPPSQLNLPPNVKLPTKWVFTETLNITDLYNTNRSENSNKNAGELLAEGSVFYVHTEGPSWTMFKCKPEEIEQIHWAASGVIPKHSIWTTLLNAFESSENPTQEEIRDLLLEEYTDQQINKSINRIKKLYSKARDHMLLTKRVNEAWAKARAEGLDVTKDKGATMRFIAQFFNKVERKRIGSIVLKQAGLLGG